VVGVSWRGEPDDVFTFVGSNMKSLGGLERGDREP
jgi:hypothetical protein